MKHWFKDHHFRLLLKNSSYLAVSQGVSAIAGIITVAAAGRALQLEMFGMLVLINSYVQAASGISKFQSWQLVVRYGGKALTQGETQEFEAATGFAFGLDIASGLVGMVVAIALLPWLGTVFGIPARFTGLAMLYCLLLPTMAAATPVGVLRALNRFDLIAWQDTATPISRAILAAIAWAVHARFEVFLAIWFVTDLVGDIYLWFLGWREARRRGMAGAFRPTLRARTLAGGWRFALQVNLNTTLQTASGPVGRLIVGSMLGPAAAALYRVASTITTGVQKPADMLLKAYYPQVVGMDFASGRPWNLMFRAAAFAGAIALCVVVLLVAAGEPIIRLIFGAHFGGAYAPLLVLSAVPLLSMVSFPVTPMLYSLDRPDVPVHARLAGTIAYLAAVVPAISAYGLPGAAAAFVLGTAVSVSMMIWALFREYRKVRSTAAPSRP